jgi:hypothetical protein
MRSALALLLAALPAAPAAALEAACAFSLECVEAEACAETDYSLTLSGGADGVTLSDSAGDVAGEVSFTPSGATYFLAVGERATHLLTVMGPAGETRYTVHLPAAGMAITYHGTCEDAR